jgi:hypothetical protein
VRPGEGDLQRAPWAFLLGSYDTQAAADARVSQLRRLEIPTYTLPLVGPPAAYRVFAGGYATADEGQVLREILQSVGEADVLVERVGRR